MGAKLNSTNLIEADLRKANLTEADLTEANLTRVDLIETQLFSTNLGYATLTGACIQDWQINSKTNLDGLQCEYIYRRSEWNEDKRENELTHRLPADPNSTFAPGEFTKLFQVLESALDTINLTFTKGIDWQAFFNSFQELRNQHRDETIVIQGMERKSDAFVVRLEVGEGTDKGAIETEIKQFYQAELTTLSAKYAEQGKHLQYERQRSAQLLANFTNIAMALAEKQGDTYNTEIHGNVGSAFNQGGIGNSAGEVDGNQIGEVGNLNQQQTDSHDG